MSTYEILYILRPDLSDDGVQTASQQVEALVRDNGGTIVEAEIWGKRRLAYKVKQFTEGCYILLRFEAPSALIPRLETHFRISEPIIRHLLVHFDEKTLRREAEQIRRKDEYIKASEVRRATRIEREELPAPVYAEGAEKNEKAELERTN